MSDRKFGDIDGYGPGAWFKDRQGLYRSKLHATTQAGIVGSQYQGAESIVLNGGYEDDEDHGSFVIYTGAGGQNQSGTHVKDQTLTGPNLALKLSCDAGLPVRVIRGSKGEPEFSPDSGYRYDGLYEVTRYWPHHRDSDGYLVWRFRLDRLGSEPETEPSGTPGRRSSTQERIVRDAELVSRIKAIYGNACQVCGTVVETPGGEYSEAAHIRPLGRPDDGPDVIGNMLCLCPNHHAAFDRGGFVLSDELTVLENPGLYPTTLLSVKAGHEIDIEHVGYHRTRWLHNENEPS